MTTKVTDLEKFSLEHIWRPYLTLVMEEQHLTSPPMSLDETAAKLREDTPWSRHVLSRIKAIGFRIPAYVNHPLADIVRALSRPRMDGREG
jgi:hypothetical protein